MREMDGGVEIQAKLRDLDKQLEEGEITQKGYDKWRAIILAEAQKPTTQSSALDAPRGADHAIGGSPYSYSASVSPYTQAKNELPYRSRPQTPQVQIQSYNDYGRESIYSGQPGPDPAYQYQASAVQSDYSHSHVYDQDNPSPGGYSRLSTMDAQAYFSDFAGQQYQAQRDSIGGPNRYSSGDVFSPLAAQPPYMPSDFPAAVDCQMPLEPRGLPFAVFDPHDGNVPMSRFENIGAVLRHRANRNARQAAYWVLDSKGKETASITWEKLASRAEKVAQVIRDKSDLCRGDRVALVYRDTEVIDFTVSLLGCFIAGVVAVPINELDDYQKLSLLLANTQSHLVLTTDNNLKSFTRGIAAQRLKWPTGVEWWKTNEFKGYHPRRRDEVPPLHPPDLAYIEFQRAPTGELRGVVLSHLTIMHQMACITAILQRIPEGSTSSNAKGETILSYLDPREGPGIILGVLLGVYGGHTTVWMEAKSVEIPGLYAHVISKYSTTVMVADYPGLKRAAYNYQQDPWATRNFKKNPEPNFGPVKICLIDALAVDSEFHEILADRWLKPLRNMRAREVVAPMLCLPEHGGMIISVRDWLGGEESMGIPLSRDEHEEIEEDKVDRTVNSNGYTGLIGGYTVKKQSSKVQRAELTEVLLDKEALKTNEVVVLATGEEARRKSNDPGTVRVGSFGFPLPDATLAIVDPETSLLCPPYTVGEVWVDSPSLSGGFWKLPRHTEQIFHARPYKFEPGNPTPVVVKPGFLRTGLLGCVVDGKVFTMGLYEDRIRQRVEWVESGVREAEYRFFFVQHLIISIMKSVPSIYDCSAFDKNVNEEYLPIIVIETQAASTAPTNPGGPPRQLDIPLLDSLSDRIMEILYQQHHLRVYCVMVTAPNALPRVMKNGRKEIGNMLCRREFDNGTLACVYVKFGVERAIQNLALGDDPTGGIWSPISAQARQHMLLLQDKQYSGVDHREVIMDDKTSTSLNQFSNIHDLMQWRVSKQAEELAYCSVDVRGREGKSISWKKFDAKVGAVAMLLKNKIRVQPRDRLLLMYTHSEDFVYAVHACFALGVVAIPMAPIDQNRLNEDAPALLHMISDYGVKAILVNYDVDNVLKQKPVSQHLRQSAMILKVNIPSTINTTKPPKQSHGCRELNLAVKPSWVQPEYPVLIWVYWTPDQRRIAIQLGHKNIMALCKVQKETCQMSSTRPVLGCVRSTVGLGFLHTCLMGVFLASPTYLVSPIDFAQNPNLFFQTVAKYKIKDTYATSQMLEHAMAAMPIRGGLYELKNLMIATDGRPRPDDYHKVRGHFAQSGLDGTAINTIFSHVINPMIATRSYMCVEPIEIWLDMHSLRRGLVVAVDPDTDAFALRLHDSGMVPVNTHIAIVNPETNRLCLVGEYGEIWVQSEANAHSFYGSKDAFDVERFNGRTVDGDPKVRYMRTGELGFLHTVSRPIGPGGSQVEMQVLFVLGNIGDTFEVNGLSHFAMDIEVSVERCNRNVCPGGCTVFQAGGLVVVVVEIFRKNFLASIVPVIVNAVLDAHHLVVDIVAFVSRGDFPRSRLGEKQRGKILGSWVTRKMRTLAQFSIRDPDGSESSQVTMTMTDSGGMGGSGGDRELRNGSLRGTGIGMSTSAPSLKRVAEDDSQQQQYQGSRQSQGQYQQQLQQQSRLGSPRLALNIRPEEYQSIPTGMMETPTQRYADNDSLDFSRNGSIKKNGSDTDRGNKNFHGSSYRSNSTNDATPTEPSRRFELPETSENLTYPLYSNQTSDTTSGSGVGEVPMDYPSENSNQRHLTSTTSGLGNGLAGSNNYYEDNGIRSQQQYYTLGNQVEGQQYDAQNDQINQQRQRNISAVSDRSVDRVSVDEEWPIEAIMHMNYRS